MRKYGYSILWFWMLCFCITQTGFCISIDSVYPNAGRMDEELTISIKGAGFPENARISCTLDTGNEKHIMAAWNTSGKAVAAHMTKDHACVADGKEGLVVIDMHDPHDPFPVGAYPTQREAKDVFVSGNTAYLAVSDWEGYSRLVILDISRPWRPRFLGSANTPGHAQGVFVYGSFACIADYTHLTIINVADPEHPEILAAVEIGNLENQGYVRDVVVSGAYAYLAADHAGLCVVDVSRADAPAILGFTDTPGNAYAVDVKNQTAYVADGSSGLFIAGISNPEKPVHLGSLDTTGDARDIAVNESRACIADGSAGIVVADISEPGQPEILGSVKTPGTATGIFVEEDRAIVADGRSGIQVVDIHSPESHAVIGAMNTTGSAGDIFVENSSAYVTAYAASSGGRLEIMDVSAPSSPKLLGVVSTPGMPRKVVVSEDYAYIADFFSLQVADVSDPSSPVMVASLAMEAMDPLGYVQDVFVSGNYAYLAADYAGLGIVDVSDPQNPFLVKTLDTPGNAMGIFVVGSKAYVADWEKGLAIFDVSDPQNPFLLGQAETPGFAGSVFVSENFACITNGDLLVIDIADSTSPFVRGSLDMEDAGEVVVSENRAYIASRDSGIQVADLRNPANPVAISSVETAGSAHAVRVMNGNVYTAAGDAGLVIFPEPTEPVLTTFMDSGKIRAVLTPPSIPGTYNLRVYTDTYGEVMTGAVTFLTALEYEILYNKKAIIVLGGGPEDRIWHQTRHCAIKAFTTLISQGYDKERIRFFSPVSVDIDGDGFSDVYERSGIQEFLSTLDSSWAKDAGELLVYMVDHGGEGSFVINSADTPPVILQAQELDAALDTLQPDIPGAIMIIYDACRSGSFIRELKPPQGYETKRCLFTSSGPDEEAWFINDGFTSFSYSFWSSLSIDARIYPAFIRARNVMQKDQEAQIDIDGDGVPNQKNDRTLASGFILGRGRIAGNERPSIGYVCDEQTLNGEGSIEISAWQIESADPISRVWAVVKPPYADYLPFTIPVTDMPSIELQDPDGDGKYSGAYAGFPVMGSYRVSIMAENDKGCISLPKETRVIQNTGEKRLPGDINGDEKVNLEDALIALLAASGKTTGLDIRENYPESGADADRDGLITVQDAICILVQLAGR